MNDLISRLSCLRPGFSRTVVELSLDYHLACQWGEDVATSIAATTYRAEIGLWRIRSLWRSAPFTVRLAIIYACWNFFVMFFFMPGRQVPVIWAGVFCAAFISACLHSTKPLQPPRPRPHKHPVHWLRPETPPGTGPLHMPTE